MKKNTIKLTEYHLRNIVEGCVKEALEDTIKEGFGTNVFKQATKGDMSDMDFPTWEEFKELVMGNPDKAQHLYNKLMFNQAEAGHIDNTEHDAEHYANEAMWTEPGVKGKLRRGAIGAGMVGKAAMDKVRKHVNKDLRSNEDGSFTL